MFGAKIFKNVHDVRKVCLETTLRVYVYFIEFNVFVLDENHVRGTKHRYDHIYVGKFWVKIHVRPTRGPRRRTPTWSSTLHGTGSRLTQMTANQPGDGRYVAGNYRDTRTAG